MDSSLGDIRQRVLRKWINVPKRVQIFLDNKASRKRVRLSGELNSLDDTLWFTKFFLGPTRDEIRPVCSSWCFAA